MPDILIENWYGMVAPAKTPTNIVAALNRIANEAMADPSVKEKLADQGLTVPATRRSISVDISRPRPGSGQK